MLPFVVIVFLGIVIGLVLLDRKLKSKPEYVAASEIQGPNMYPIIGNTLNIMFLNGGCVFSPRTE